MKNQRIEVIDALRGFALFGIFFTHIYLLHMQHQYSPKILSLINIVYVNALFGKFFTIFSFLFGLSFSIQLQNSISRGESFSIKFLWRLTILFVMGAIHSLIYKGDILQLYALLGVLLLVFRNYSNKAILSLSLIFFLLSMAVPALRLKTNIEDNLNPVVDLISGELLRKVNWYLFSEGQLFVVATFFLLGYYVGKKDYLKNYNALLFKRVALYTGIIAIICTLILAAIFFGGLRKNPALTYLEVTISVLMRLQQVSLSILYTTIFVLLYNSKLSNKLNVITPLGKMGLSMYILQSVLVLIFHQFFINVNLIFMIIGTLVLYAGQIILAKIWMSKFKFGPIEWLWRTLTNLSIVQHGKN